MLSGRVAAKFFSQNHAIYEMKWLEIGDTSCDFLLILHSKTLLALWNVNSSEPIWQCRLSFNAFGFSLDPFNLNTVACGVFKDFINNSILVSSSGSTLAFVNDLKTHRLSNLQPTLLALNEGNANSDSLIQQIVFHRAVPDLIFVVLKDEV